MSMKPHGVPPIPEETVRLARESFPKGTFCLFLRDELGTIYHDEQFALLFSKRGQPAEAPWRLAVVTVLQYMTLLPNFVQTSGQGKGAYRTVERKA